jgi:hypothetical protein
MPTAYTLTTRSGPQQFPSIAAASAAYCADRDASGEGASTWPTGLLTGPDGEQFFVSYNGKVWADDPCRRDWRPGASPVFCPYAA